MAPHPTGATRQTLTLADTGEPDLLRLTLDQVDYGLLVLDADTQRVQFANPPALAALAGAPAGTGPADPARSGLCLVQGRLTGLRPAQTEQLRASLARTKAGLRALLSLSGGSEADAVAVMPLAGGPAGGPAGGAAAAHRVQEAGSPSYALMVFAKQQLCDESTVALFARERGLTGAEAQVLALVCKGLRPTQIAERHGVRISTVRTQLRSIRQKTGCGTIRELVQRVSVLPPMARRLAQLRPS